MNTPDEFIKIQYEFIKDSREALFRYCNQISREDFIAENLMFGRGGSIRNLLVHIANVYEFWIGEKYFLRTKLTSYSDVHDLTETRRLFENVDLLMTEFINAIKSDPDKVISFQLNDEDRKAGVLQLFTHVTTHEFHHKGQILSLSRHLGYIPADTDVIR